jgi:AraC family transcriptional regulator
MKPRQPGQFFGRTVATRRVPGLRLAEVHYPPGFIIPRHDHELASLCIVLAGGYDERVGACQRTCLENTVVLHPDGEHHDNYHHSKVHLLSVEVESSRLTSLREAAPVLGESAAYAGGKIVQLGASLAREFHNPEAISALAIEALALEILIESCRLAGHSQSHAPPWLSRVKEFLRVHFARNVTLAEIASAASVHPAHLTRVFRQYCGHSVGSHVRQLRLDAARLQLRDSQCTLAEVAVACGFSDQSHLTRLFHAAFGITPARYRRESAGRADSAFQHARHVQETDR